jgi:Dolichyl-phosphate-mannose-protein mannosyltransferase
VNHWSSARSQFLLTLATLLCLLPFSGKAFHIDDPLFLWSAQHITAHPLDPYGFQLIWYRSVMSMAEVTKNPPLACYYGAAIGSVFGWSERALHLGFLLPALAMVLGTYRLAQRFTSFPLVAAAATLLTPGVLVSASSVMCDTMMLSFWIWAIVFWLEGMEADKPRLLLASSLLMAAAALTKYFGICVVPLLLVYSVAKQRRIGAWAWYFLLPVSLLAGYQYWTRALYGRGMFSDALDFAPQRITNAWYLIALYPVVCASFAGGCALSVLTLAPLVWSRKYILITILLGGVAVVAGWIILGPRLHGIRADTALEQHWWTVGPELALYVAGGVSILALAALDLWKHRDAESLLLGLWVFGTFAFAAFLNWTINARTVLPLIPAVGILLARRLDALGIVLTKPLRWKVAAALLVSGATALWVAWADADLANSAMQAAKVLAQRTKNETGTVWFQGHWGFQYYAQQLGLRPLDFTQSTLNPGDLVIVPRGDYTTHAPPPQFVASDELVEIRLPQPVITMRPGMEAGFYASSYGILPFVFGAVPPERYHLYNIGTRMRPEDWQLQHP